MSTITGTYILTRFIEQDVLLLNSTYQIPSKHLSVRRIRDAVFLSLLKYYHYKPNFQKQSTFSKKLEHISYSFKKISLVIEISLYISYFWKLYLNNIVFKSITQKFTE